MDTQTTRSTLQTIFDRAPYIEFGLLATGGIESPRCPQVGIRSGEQGIQDVRAVGFEFAALMELAVPSQEGWTVDPDMTHKSVVFLTLDLATAEEAEFERAEAFLSKVPRWTHRVEDALAQPHTLSARMGERRLDGFGDEGLGVEIVPEPELEVRVPAGTPRNQRNALVYALAMEVQRKKPANAKWYVFTEFLDDERAFVRLQLNRTQASRGLALLNKVANAHKA